MNPLPSRGRPVHLPVQDAGNRSAIIFLTVCVENRRSLLASPERHECLINAWRKADAWLVGRYVLMPDHLHLFCAAGTLPPASLKSWVAYWKRLVAFANGGSFWQKNFWDTQLRRHESYEAKWEYVRQNPVRAGLVSKPAEWAYQGELHELRWHE